MNRLIDVYKILSDETRLRIAVLLVQEELCVCELCGILNLSQPKVSKHLAKLRDKNLVVDKRREQFIFYSLNTENKFWESTIKNIFNEIEEYSQLKEDSERLVDKDIYLMQCNI
ncbi:MAG: metalloregulator ArsR/SmtB family transcription factor [Clostridiales bacterium]|nr:metalloregulator ArsR/SmtB family transcription factor [Clostridiales bacterium]